MEKLEQEQVYLERLIRVDMESSCVIGAIFMLTLGISFILQSVSLTISSFNQYYFYANIASGLQIGLVPVAMIGVYWVARWIDDWRKLKRVKVQINLLSQKK